MAELAAFNSPDFVADSHTLGVRAATGPQRTVGAQVLKHLHQQRPAFVHVAEHPAAGAVTFPHLFRTAFRERLTQLAAAKLIGELYTGSLGQPGGEARTYLALMRYNTTTIVGELR